MSLNSSSSASFSSSHSDYPCVEGDDDTIMDTPYGGGGGTVSHTQSNGQVVNGITATTGSDGQQLEARVPSRGLTKDEVLLRVLGPPTSSVVTSSSSTTTTTTSIHPITQSTVEDKLLPTVAVNTEELATATALRTEALLARESSSSSSSSTIPSSRHTVPHIENNNNTENNPTKISSSMGQRQQQEQPAAVAAVQPFHYQSIGLGGGRNLYAIPKTGSIHPSSTVPPPHHLHHPSTLPPGGYQASGLIVAASKFPPGTFIAPSTTRQQQQQAAGLPTFLSSPSAYDAMYTAAMLRQQGQQHRRVGGNTITIGKHTESSSLVNNNQQYNTANGDKEGIPKPSAAAAAASAAGVKRSIDSVHSTATAPALSAEKQISDGSLAVNIDRVATEQIKKATTTPKPKGASGISTISNHGPPQAAAPPPTTPQSAPKRRRVSAKAKAAAGGDVKNGKGGTDMSTSGVIAVKTKGVQVGTQLQDINGEVSLLSKPKNPVMTPPLRWQSSHQMPPHSLEDAFEVWSFCCNYSESLLDIKPVTAGEYADALFARGLAPLMQEIHLALLRIVIPHVAYLSCSHASDGSSNVASSYHPSPLLGYLPLNISSKTITLGWQYLTAEVVLTVLGRDSNNSIDATTRHEMTEAAKWFNRVEYKDIPPRVRITVLKALLQSCEVSPLFVRYQSCVSAALAKAKVSMGRLARIENESMQKETEIGRSILIEGIESRRRELKEMESRLRALNMWAKFGTTNIETDEEEEDKIEDIKDETESGGDMSPVLSSLGRESSITTTAMVPLCSDNIKKELGIWGNRRRIVTAVRQQATRALLRVAPDEIPGKQPTSAGLDRSGNSYFIIPQANTTSPSICVRYSDGGLGFYQTEADVEGLVSSLDKEPSRQEGKLRRHILEATAKDLNIRQSYPPDLRTTEGLTSISSASELNNIIQALRKEANRLLELTVKVKPIAEVSDSYLSLKAAAVKPSLELPNTLTVEGLLSTEAALGEKVEWVSQEERNAFLSVLKSNTSEEKELIMTNGGSGWWSGYENGCNNESIDNIVEPLTAAELKELGRCSKGDKSPVIASAPMIRWDVLGGESPIKSEHNGSVSVSAGSLSTPNSNSVKRSKALHECKSCGRVFKSQGGLTQHTNRGCKGPTMSIHHNNTSPSASSTTIVDTPPTVEPYPLAPSIQKGPSSPVVIMCLGWLLERAKVK